MNISSGSMKLARESARAAKKEHAAKRDKLKSENGARFGVLKKFGADSLRSSKILAHNGVVVIAWAVPMFLVAYVALQAAFYAAAVVLGQTGGILMETPVDVVTTYIVIAMVCAFDLFFAFKLENAAIRAMKRRLWRADMKTGGIDRGDFWRERHGDGE